MSKEKKEKKGFWKEFGEFIAKGNILDLAVAVIIGAAFNAIVKSLTNDIIMPLVTLAMGENSLADVSLVLKPEVLNELGEVITPALTWNYGNFLQSIIDFLIIALVVFVFVKVCMKVKTATEAFHNKAEEIIDEYQAKKNGEKTEQTQEETETKE